MTDSPLDHLPTNPSYEQLRDLEHAMLTQLEPREAPVTHHYAQGVYGREMFIPAGTMLTGKIHKFSTLNFLMQGEITVTTPEGMKRISAPAIFTSPPGCKKAGYAHTDVIWVNVHPTKLTNPDDIEAKFIQAEPPHVLDFERKLIEGES